MQRHLRPWTIRKLKGFDDLWDVLRGGYEGNGEWIEVDENDQKLIQEYLETEKLGRPYSTNIKVISDINMPSFQSVAMIFNACILLN